MPGKNFPKFFQVSVGGRTGVRMVVFSQRTDSAITGHPARSGESRVATQTHTRQNFYKYFGQPKRKKIFSFFFTFQMILNNFQFCREKIFRNFSKCLSGAGPVCGWLSSVNGRIALLPGTPPALGRVGSQHRPTPDKIFTSILVSQNGKKYFDILACSKIVKAKIRKIPAPISLTFSFSALAFVWPRGCRFPAPCWAAASWLTRAEGWQGRQPP